MRELGRLTYLLEQNGWFSALIVGAERALCVDPCGELRPFIESVVGTEMPIFCIYTGAFVPAEGEAAAFDEAYCPPAYARGTLLPCRDGDHFHLGGVHVGLSGDDRLLTVTVTREGVQTFVLAPGFGPEIPAREAPSPFTVRDGVLVGFDRSLHETRIAIPAGVTEIADGLFEGDLELSFVLFPEGLKRIGRRAFYGCRNLRAAHLPESVETLGEGCFGICGLEEIYIPPRVSVLPKECFDGCMGYTALHVPGTVREIGELCFSANRRVRRARIDEGVEILRRRAFNGNPELEDITLPQSLRVIEAYAFDGSMAPRVVVLSGEIRRVEDKAFAGCHGLEALCLGEGIEALGAQSFAYCNRLREVSVPASLRAVGPRCFSGCSALEHLALPESCAVAEDSFYACKSLKK